MFNDTLLSNGSIISVGDYDFEVGVAGGAGGYYTLTTIPEPGLLALLGIAGLVLAAWRSGPHDHSSV